MKKKLEWVKSTQKATQVYCLCIDMIDSTQTGLGFPNIMFDCFNIAVVKQIEPHLKRYDLTDALIKFTGDGWLVMTNKTEKVQSLCCLAITMACEFREDICRVTEINKKLIPSLRLAICGGRDISVELLDGNKDWVGDSARRATRSSGFCMPNEIIIDENVRSMIFRDFSIESFNPEQRLPKYQPKRMEEKFKLYILKGQIDILEKWNKVIDNCSDYSEALDMLKMFESYKLSPNTNTYNILINKSPNYSTALDLFDEMVSNNIHPNDFTFNTLIKKASDYKIAMDWLNKMIENCIQPDIITINTLIKKAPNYNMAKDLLENIVGEDIKLDVVTYNLLIYKAPDYDKAKYLFNKMEDDGISQNIFTYNTFIKKVPDYDTAKGLVSKMNANGIQPNKFTYNTLFNKNLSGKSAEDILKWYLAQKYHPEEPIQSLIASYRKTSSIDQAIRLLLDYPHLQASRKIIRENSEEVFEYLNNIFDKYPQHPNAAYALGVAFQELRNGKKSELYLKKALKLATDQTRKTNINKWLLQISSVEL